MAIIKFSAAIAARRLRSPLHCDLDSGGTHHFYLSRSSYQIYGPNERTTVISASASSYIVGMGLDKLPFDNSRVVEAFHTLDFSINILFIGNLTGAYEIRFTRDNPTQPDISFCIISHCGSGNVVSEATIFEGL